LQKWGVVVKFETSCLSCELLSALSVSKAFYWSFGLQGLQ
jgi:hypothetical protein